MLQSITSESKRGISNPAPPKPASRVFVRQIFNKSNQSTLKSQRQRNPCGCGGKCNGCSRKAAFKPGFIGESPGRSSVQQLTSIATSQLDFGNHSFLRESQRSGVPDRDIAQISGFAKFGHTSTERKRDRKNQNRSDFQQRTLAGQGKNVEPPDDLRSDFEGSGTCENGGARSKCDDDGVYKMVENYNTCCTKDCSVQHEAIHKKDHDAWGCCKALGAAYKKPGADKAEIDRKYGEWRRAVSPITECHAYTNDVKCAESLSKSKDCAGKGKGTDCCKDIDDYKEFYGERAKTTCATVPKDVPPCPKF